MKGFVVVAPEVENKDEYEEGLDGGVPVSFKIESTTEQVDLKASGSWM